jgi:hypothetical protein
MALLTNSTWPFVVIPDLEARRSYCAEVTSIKSIGFAPLVNETDRAAFQMFEVENQGWVRDGLEYQNLDPTLIANASNITEFIFLSELDRYSQATTRKEVNGSSVDFGPGDYLPIWQSAPASLRSNNVNYDLLSHKVFSEVYRAAWESRAPAMSEVIDLMSSNTANSGSDVAPHSFMVYPIYPYNSQDWSDDMNDLVAVLYVVFEWSAHFEDILPQGMYQLFLLLVSQSFS